MLRKMYFPLAIVMVAVMLGAIGCAGAQPQQKELLPCSVELSYVMNRWTGEETVVAEVALSVKNPNSIDITLDSLDYTLAIGDKEVFWETALPGICILANDEVDLRYLNFVNFSEGLGIPNYLSGMDYVTAHVAACPTWKLLEGKKPPLWSYPALQMLPAIKAGATVAEIAGAGNTPEKIPAILGQFATIKGTVMAVQGAVDKVWEGAPEGPAVYTVKGTAGISSSLGVMDVPFELSYTRE